MEAAVRRKSKPVKHKQHLIQADEQLEQLEYLKEHVAEFEFYQAIHILHGLAKKMQAKLIFKSNISTAFSGSAIERIECRQLDNQCIEIVVLINVLGFIAGTGMLPDHIIELVLERMASKDYALRDFLDLFVQRLVLLFYENWLKGHCITLKGNPLQSGIAPLIIALLGKTAAITSDKQSLALHEFYYAGLLARHVRSRESLQALLSDYFQLPIVIYNYTGEWTRLDKEITSTLRRYNRLGEDLCLGRRYWDTARCFTVQIGPVGRDDFTRLLPTEPLLIKLKDIVQQAVGDEYRCQITIALKKEAIENCQLRYVKHVPMRLGWNSFLAGEEKHPVEIQLGEIPQCCRISAIPNMSS